MSNDRSSRDGLDGTWLRNGVVLGFVVGAIVTLLTAPISGLPLRRRIQQRAAEARERISGSVRGAIPEDRLDSSIEAGKAAARRLMDSNSAS